MRSSVHKGNHERALLTARAKIGTLLDKDEVVGPARQELEEISALIRSVELIVGQQRLAEPRLKHPSLETYQEEDLASQHRRQLVEVYTDCDPAAADGNKAISPRKFVEGDDSVIHRGVSSSSVGQGARRLSTQELDARVATVLSSQGCLKLLEDDKLFHFDALRFAHTAEVQRQPIFVLFTYMEEKLRLSKQLRDLGQVSNATVFHKKLMHFMEKMDNSYKDNEYHSSAHAADVCMTLEWFFQSRYVKERTSSLDHLMGLIAGAIHDVGHPGTNNLFHSKTMSPLAIRYNDKSILENMHVSFAFEVMQTDPTCNWFEMLPEAFKPDASSLAPVNLHQYVRKSLVHMVLATDMAKHARQVQELKVFVADQLDSSSPSDVKADLHDQKQEALDNKLFLLDTLLHSSDIFSPAKPQPIMLKWTHAILKEFWMQGDEERRLGLPISPLCDRATEQIAVPKGQLGFIDFVVRPLYTPLSRLIPEMQEAMGLLEHNRAFWEEKGKEGATYEQLFPAQA